MPGPFAGPFGDGTSKILRRVASHRRAPKGSSRCCSSAIQTRYLGEDRLTCRPIEPLASMRLILDQNVIRSADRAECCVDWSMVATPLHCLSRSPAYQFAPVTRDLPKLTRPLASRPQCREGSRCADDAANPESDLLAPGNEVGVAVEAQAKIAVKGRRAGRFTNKTP